VSAAAENERLRGRLSTCALTFVDPDFVLRVFVRTSLI